MTENANIVINSAKAIGCVVVNVRAEDIIDGKEHLILGLIWQIIRRGLLSKIDIKHHPELYRLLEDDETLEQFLRLPRSRSCCDGSTTTSRLLAGTDGSTTSPRTFVTVRTTQFS